MTFSHHSHSGQFCAHAKNTLEEMVQSAIANGMETFAVTEHMPREHQDLYIEEKIRGLDSEALEKQFYDYYFEARRVQRVYASEINVLVGFESEWIRPSTYLKITDLLRRYRFDLFVGSVHHVCEVPIDISKAQYDLALSKAGGTTELLFQKYFDDQFEMLQALKPPIVGHFDLIRLFHDETGAMSFGKLPEVWARIHRNLKFIASYGGLLELNTAAIRKGLRETYPTRDICRAFLALEGKFTLSDDAHAVEHVGSCYEPALLAAQQVGIERLHYLQQSGKTTDERFPGISVAMIPIQDVLRGLPTTSRSLQPLDRKHTCPRVQDHPDI